MKNKKKEKHHKLDFIMDLKFLQGIPLFQAVVAKLDEAVLKFKQQTINL